MLAKLSQYISELLQCFGDVFLVNDNGAGRGDVMAAQQFGQVDFVGATHDGGGVVDHHQSFGLGPAQTKGAPG